MRPDNPNGGSVRPCSSERLALIQFIEQALTAIPEASSGIKVYPPGVVILEEGKHHGRIGLLLEGEAALQKRTETGETARVDIIGRGEMIGLLSYYAHEMNFVGVHALTDVRVLLLKWADFDRLQKHHAELGEALAQLMRDNLIGRYRRLVNFHLDVARLNQELAAERAELKRTITELEQTRSRLINQEKLAMLGKIVAGLAHELNNPVSAISRNTDFLAESVERILASSADASRITFWEAGQKSSHLDTRTQRDRQELLAKRFPKLSRPLLRRLAAVPAETLDSLAHPPQSDAAWELWLSPFESGRFVYTLSSASDRIARLVRSLKNYARPGHEGLELVDIAAGLRDTLLILAHHFKALEVRTQIQDLPSIQGNAGEINQVWTNLLVNASEAMNGTGTLIVDTSATENTIVVTIEDTGPGIPDESMGTIFEPHFTTKAQGGQFGLGLGLSIAREIVQKHGGSIQARNLPTCGVRFTVSFPVAIK